MRDLEIKKENFYGYIPKNRKDYLTFIRSVLDDADAVCFTVKPYLDNIDEFNRSIWSQLQYSVVDYGFARAASNFKNEKSHLILFQNDYFIYQFFMEKDDIFAYAKEDANLGITLEDPAFIKDGEVFCYTVTHEKICIVTKNIFMKLNKHMMKKLRNCM